MLKSTIANSGKFYMEKGGSYKNAHLVTAEATNHNLGISHIGLRNPETTSAKAPIFKLTLELDNGIVVYGDIFVNRDGESLNVRWPQDSFLNSQNKTQYVDKVNVPSAITAQVLRYAQTHVTVAENVQQQTQAPVQQAPVQQVPVQQNAVQQAPVEQAPVNGQLNFDSMSQEQINDLVNQFAR